MRLPDYHVHTCFSDGHDEPRAYPFDYVLCSVHFVDGFGFIERHNRKAAGWRDVDQVWRRDYEMLIEATQTGAFDVVAHLDLPKKWGYRPTANVSGLENDALQAIAAAGLAIEINTSGYDRHPLVRCIRRPACSSAPAAPASRSS